MTLAKILFIGVCGIAWAFSAGTADAQQSAQSTSSAESGAGAQEGAPSAQPAEKKQLPADAKSTKKPSSKKVRRKKPTIADCPVTPDASPAASAAPSASNSAPDSLEAQNAGAAKKDPCPPPKTVVHQGGTTDTSIQLAGGPGSQSSQANATAGPMLDATETNLKKLEGRQLSDTEQDMVTQIRQFMLQSKTAVAAGDVERARTLAWKAQTLSEDLVKPEK
jgi:hypothetical protein